MDILPVVIAAAGQPVSVRPAKRVWLSKTVTFGSERR